MTTHWDETVRNDVERIASGLTQMAELTVLSLRDALRAIADRNRTLAYSVVVRDQRVDAMEKANDRACLEFLVREQPAAALLRFAYAAIRVNLELERVGDYAESIARQSLKLIDAGPGTPPGIFEEVAEPAIRMVPDAVRAFVAQDAELARKVIEMEDAVDGLKSRLNRNFVEQFRRNELSFEALNASMMIVRHYERVSDQARNICMEALYSCTGEYTRHRDSDTCHLLFVESRGSFLGAVARAVAERLGARSFAFAAVSLDPRALTAAEAEFVRGLGADPWSSPPQMLTEVPQLDHYGIIVALDPGVRRAFPQPPRKAVFIDWSAAGAPAAGQPAEDPAAAGAAAARYLEAQLRELVGAIEGGGASAPENRAP